MSLSSAVYTAMLIQLGNMGRDLPKTGRETMSGDYNFVAATMQIFLTGVSDLLSKDTPSYGFDPTKLDMNACLGDTFNALCGDIGGVTTT